MTWLWFFFFFDQHKDFLWSSLELLENLWSLWNSKNCVTTTLLCRYSAKCLTASCEISHRFLSLKRNISVNFFRQQTSQLQWWLLHRYSCYQIPWDKPVWWSTCLSCFSCLFSFCLWHHHVLEFDVISVIPIPSNPALGKTWESAQDILLAVASTIDVLSK